MDVSARVAQLSHQPSAFVCLGCHFRDFWNVLNAKFPSWSHWSMIVGRFFLPFFQLAISLSLSNHMRDFDEEEETGGACRTRFLSKMARCTGSLKWIRIHTQATYVPEFFFHFHVSLNRQSAFVCATSSPNTCRTYIYILCVFQEHQPTHRWTIPAKHSMQRFVSFLDSK